MNQYIKLVRPFHWIKNILVFLPIGFSGRFLEWGRLWPVILSWLAFNLIASSVYVLNDIQDADKDRQHPTKKYRPIASGAISKSAARIFLLLMLLVFLVLTLLIGYQTHNFWALAFPLAYFIINLGYSGGLKNVPLLDVSIIALGFLLRLLYGGAVSNVPISKWLLLTVISASFFLGFGKRRNELSKTGDSSKTRAVLKGYNYNFLDKIMYVFVGLTLTFYSLWTINVASAKANDLLVYSVPLVMLIVANYSLIIEGDSDGDPAEVLLHSKSLLLMLVLYVAVVFCALYL